MKFHRLDCLFPDDVDGRETSRLPGSEIVRVVIRLILTCGVGRGEPLGSDLRRVVVEHCRGGHWTSVVVLLNCTLMVTGYKYVHAIGGGVFTRRLLRTMFCRCSISCESSVCWPIIAQFAYYQSYFVLCVEEGVVVVPFKRR